MKKDAPKFKNMLLTKEHDTIPVMLYPLSLLIPLFTYQKSLLKIFPVCFLPNHLMDTSCHVNVTLLIAQC